MSDSLFAKTATNRLLGMPDGGELGSMALDVSINGSPFTLIYRAREDSFDGSSQQIARGLVNFARKYHCNYALLVGKNCWIADAKGLSIAAQLEDDDQLKQYQMVVVPLDEMIYLAKIDNGLLSEEKVYPIERALEHLIATRSDQDNKGEIAILKGGLAAKALHQNGFEINFPFDIAIQGKVAQAYSYQSLNALLLSQKLYHHRLLIPVGALLAALLSLSLLLYYYSHTATQVIVEEEIEQTQLIELETKPDFLNNHAAQVLRQIRPWILPPKIDFLNTCRLTSITINSNDLIYYGQWMDSLEPSKQGCGNRRLEQVIRDNTSLELFKTQMGWGVRGIQLPVEGEAIPRVPTQQILHQLELLANYIDWQISTQSIDSDGDNRDIELIIRGKQLNAPIVDNLISLLITLPARLQQGHLQFDPDSLSLTQAEFSLMLYTVGDSGP